jgi:hypothetical protein
LHFDLGKDLAGSSQGVDGTVRIPLEVYVGAWGKGSFDSVGCFASRISPLRSG